MSSIEREKAQFAPTKRKPKIVLLVDTTKGHTRSFIRGFGGYCRTHGPWDVYVQHLSNQPGFIKFSENCNADAFVCAVDYVVGLEKLLAFDIPITVPKGMYPEHKNFYPICSDYYNTGQLAAEYYMEKGFKSFAFCGYKNVDWSQGRRDGYCQKLQAKGFSVSVYEENINNALRHEEKELSYVAKWLKKLRRPVAIFAANDLCALDILEECRLAGLKVPEEIAVLGVDNNEMECIFLSPPLSSIELNTKRAGYEIAELLDGLFAGKAVDSSKISVEPKSVIERQSTDILQIQDKNVANALRYIHQNSNKILHVSDVVKFIGGSRRSLERKFTQILDRTIYNEISKCHTEYIIHLLLETDMPILMIARSIGYTSEFNMSHFFHKATGLSPKEYRKKFSPS